jgi:LacI family transcriptional regulator
LPRNCAIFAVNDDVAAEIVAAARHAAHLSIPRDLTLLGVDNLVAVCEASRPSITSIQLDHERAGFLAARMLGDNISHKGTETQRNMNSQHPRVNSIQGGSLCGSVALCDKHFTVGPLMAVRRESTRGHGRRDPAILAAVEDIRRKACDGLTVAALVARFPGSRRLFDMRFREAMGHSALDEILQVRMEQVMGLLSRPDIPIDAIADFCGFGCRYELRKLFHARYGVSMSQWRRDNCQ